MTNHKPLTCIQTAFPVDVPQTVPAFFHVQVPIQTISVNLKVFVHDSVNLSVEVQDVVQKQYQTTTPVSLHCFCSSYVIFMDKDLDNVNTLQVKSLVGKE